MMDWLRQLRFRFLALFRRRSMERDMAEEMRAHLELEADAHRSLGLSETDAAHAAQRQFGGIEQVKEHAREASRLLWLEQLGQDLRFGWRQLVRAPGFAVVSIVTIALGIGACTALFSVANKMLLHPLDYDEPDQVVIIWETTPRFARAVTSPGYLHAWQTQTSVFSDVAGQLGGSMRLSQGERFLPLASHYVSPNFLRLTRVRPDLGREFTADEFTEGRNRVALLSRGLWQTAFGSRTDVLGEVIHLNEQPYTVIGVINDPVRTGNYVVLPGMFANKTDDFMTHGLLAWGRLKPGATVAQAQQQLDVIAARVAAEHPNPYKGRGALAVRYVDFVSTGRGLQIGLLLGATGLLLLIACVNVVNLLLARASTRQREIAVRLALGAKRGRIVRQLLCETMLLAVGGGVLGVALAWLLIGPLAFAAKSALYRPDRIAIDGWVLLGSLALIMLTTVGIGLIPALQATQGNLVEPLKEGGQTASGGRTRQRTRQILIVLQVAAACVLLIGTGLLLRSLRTALKSDLGMATDPVYTLSFSLDSRRAYNSPEKIAAFTRAALERISALPGVMSASLTAGLPGERNPRDGFILEGQPMPTGPADPITMTDLYPITPGYLQGLGIPLIAGREFTPRDGVGAAPVVLINQEMARRHFAGLNPVGHRLLLLDDPKTWHEIVGVVGDTRSKASDQTEPQVYRPLEQLPSQDLYLVLKVSAFSPALASGVREALLACDPDLTLYPLRPYNQTLALRWSQMSFTLTLFSLFSGFALILAAVGIYGVTAYAVAQRTREIGIRVALGALPGDVLRLILRRSLVIVGLGLIIGLAAAAALTRLMQSMLYATDPSDPITFVLVALAIAPVALLASWLPARRATKVSPIVALRHD
ncbi:MAG: ABC transporter permease [Verrucomicrobia bacterium]|nr:ABC transporter permease [Verrucomicrobiota bacterium]